MKFYLSLLVASLLFSQASFASSENRARSTLKKVSKAISRPFEYINQKIDKDPEIVRLAQQITAGKKTDWGKSYAIYRWVSSNISYGDSGRGLLGGSVKSIIKNGQAQCNGYSMVMRALHRALDIKIRSVTATISAPWYSDRPIAHVWNQVYLKGRWVDVDATWGSQYPNQYFDFGGHEDEGPNLPSAESLGDFFNNTRDAITGG
jgi:transglutaminase-like putative cysteine protease